MSVIFSKSCEYAVQAVLLLARKRDDGPVLLRELSDTLNIPFHFLNKILQQLSRSGLVVSQKGSGGGFTVGRDPRTIKLAEIVHAVDGDTVLTQCVLGFPKCDDKSPCPVHSEWVHAKKHVTRMLNEKTVLELSKVLDKKLRLTPKKKVRK